MHTNSSVRPPNENGQFADAKRLVPALMRVQLYVFATQNQLLLLHTNFRQGKFLFMCFTYLGFFFPDGQVFEPAYSRLN